MLLTAQLTNHLPDFLMPPTRMRSDVGMGRCAPHPAPLPKMPGAVTPTIPTLCVCNRDIEPLLCPKRHRERAKGAAGRKRDLFMAYSRYATISSWFTQR